MLAFLSIFLLFLSMNARTGQKSGSLRFFFWPSGSTSRSKRPTKSDFWATLNARFRVCCTFECICTRALNEPLSWCASSHFYALSLSLKDTRNVSLIIAPKAINFPQFQFCNDKLIKFPFLLFRPKEKYFKTHKKIVKFFFLFFDDPKI